MDGISEFQTFGMYIPAALFDAIEEDLYEKAGCLGLETYFHPATGTVPRGDPVAEATAVWSADVRSNFASLYDAADFERAEETPTDAYTLFTIATRPRDMYDLRDRFNAAALIQESDTRVVHTAIIREAVDQIPFPSIDESMDAADMAE